MIKSDETESGYINMEESGCYIGSEMRDLEILHITNTNVIARGCRYGRQWFIKGLREEFRDSTPMRRQLIKEFEIHSRLHHSSVVQAIGLDEIDGIGLCIVQEWVEGITLRAALQKGALNAAERKEIMHRLIEAVAYLHRSGVVHRDLKPSNVMIRSIGNEIVLIDFGLADTSDYLEWKQPAGTAGYISPQQLQAGGADPADDVYSLGILMREVCPAYTSIADRCTGLPSGRPKDAGELLKIIERRLRRLKLFAIIMIAVAICLLSALAVWRIYALENTADDHRRNISVLAAENETNTSLVTTLRDSLANMHNKLGDTEKELMRLKEYENLRLNTLKEGFCRIDNLLKSYDIKISKIPSDSMNEFSTVNSRLLN
ncbi:MAG: serine/threonine protein kinase, partial [Muribaculaceae bacterium]|nr:serine/threonine protein kinase [Muribaculaceae bacterium]